MFFRSFSYRTFGRGWPLTWNRRGTDESNRKNEVSHICFVTSSMGAIRWERTAKMGQHKKLTENVILRG